MVLHGEHRAVVEAEAFQGAVEQGDVGFHGGRGQRVLDHHEAVVLTGDFDLAGF